MAESNTNSAAESVLKSVQAAHQIQGAVKTGKAIAGMAKGAAAGGPYGAIAGLAWENKLQRLQQQLHLCLQFLFCLY